MARISKIKKNGKIHDIAAYNRKCSARCVIGLDGVHTADEADILIKQGDDGAAIINAALADDGVIEVVLLDGDYYRFTPTTQTISIPKGKTLRGSENTRLVVNTVDEYDDDSNQIYYNYPIIVLNESATLKDLVYDIGINSPYYPHGACITANGKNGVIENIVLDLYNNYDLNEFIVINKPACIVRGCSTTGLLGFGSGRFITIAAAGTGSIVENCHNTYVYGNIVTVYANNCKIINNNFDYATTESEGEYGSACVYLNGNNNIVDGNTCVADESGGYPIHASDTASNNIITNNYFINGIIRNIGTNTVFANNKMTNVTCSYTTTPVLSVGQTEVSEEKMKFLNGVSQDTLDSLKGLEYVGRYNITSENLNTEIDKATFMLFHAARFAVVVSENPAGQIYSTHNVSTCYFDDYYDETGFNAGIDSTCNNITAARYGYEDEDYNFVRGYKLVFCGDTETDVRKIYYSSTGEEGGDCYIALYR